MKLIKIVLAAFSILIVILALSISKQKINNEARDYWQLKLLTFYYGEAYQFKSFNEGNERPVIFSIPKFSTLDQERIPITLKNSSSSPFFTWSFDQVFPNQYLEIIEFYPNCQDILYPQLIGCGTGMFIREIERSQIIETTTVNPYHFYLGEIQFRGEKLIIPDSIAIRTKIFGFSMPWSKFRSEFIYSNPMMINHDSIKKDLPQFINSHNK